MVNRLSPFFLEVAKGNVEGHSLIQKFGTNEDVDIGTEDIWEHGGSVSYPASALTLNISSSDANDTSAGTGARTIIIEGLASDFTPQSETIILDGQTIVTTANTYRRLFTAYVVTSGTSNWNEGIIYIYTGTETAGVPDTSTLVCSSISAEHGRTLQAFYTVPANYTAYLYYGYASTDAAAKPIQIKMFTRPNADEATASWNVGMDLKTGNHFPKPYELPLRIPEKTDIRVQGTADANNTYVAAGFDLLLVKNS